MTFFLALSTLIGTVVGAGIFAMPYLVAQSGALIVAVYAVVLGATVLVIHMLLGEVCLRTHETRRLIGYGSLYRGSTGQVLFFATTMFGVVGTLLAYFILGGEFLRIIASPLLELNGTSASLALWGALSALIIRGIRTISVAELVMNGALFVSVLLVVLLVLPQFRADNVMLVHVPNAFLPFGALLFSFVGWAAIPELSTLLKHGKDKASLDNLLVWGAVIPGFLYLVFGIVVAGVSGSFTTPQAFEGLFPFLPKEAVYLGAFFGLISVATSALVLGNYLKNSLRHDLSFPFPLAVFAAALLPPALYFLGFREFLQVIGIVGGVAFALEGIGILWVYLAARTQGQREPEYHARVPRIIVFLAMIVLVAGALGEFVISFLWQ